MMSKFKEYVSDYEEGKQLKERRDKLEDMFATTGGKVESKKMVQFIIDFTLRVSVYNGYNHDLVVLTPRQYRIATGLEPGEPIETKEIWAKHEDGTHIPVTYSESVDELTLVNTDYWPESEDLS